MALQLIRSISGASARRVATALLCFVAAMGPAGCIPDTQVEPVNIANLVDTGQLRKIFGNPKNLKGVQYNRAVGITFQETGLQHLPGPKYMYANTKSFPSQERERETGRLIKSVIPDGVTGATEGSPSPLAPTITTHPESTFIEVKAVRGTIDLKYGRWQILGMLDALTKSPAASSTGPRRAYPSLYFIVTADTSLSVDIQEYATPRNILVWVSGVVQLWTGEFQVTPPACLNCTFVLHENASASTLFGPTFSFPKLGGAGSGGLDAPILDDHIVGFPGLPGDTSPNP